MFNHRTARIGILFAVLILALGAVGIGSALWSETITIDGNVTTGHVDIDFGMADAMSGDPYVDCDVLYDKDALLVTMTNAFPTYECALTFDVFNTGLIPVLVDAPLWDMPPEVVIGSSACYPDGTFMEPGEGYICGVLFEVTDLAAPSSTYTFHADINAVQITLP